MQKNFLLNNLTIIPSIFIRSTYFFEKSLKQSLNLFCNLVGMWFSSKSGVKNTVAISIGPWFTVVPEKATLHFCSRF